MTRAALLGLALLTTTAHARAPDVEDPHWIEVHNCGQYVKTLWIDPDLPPYAGDLTQEQYRQMPPAVQKRLDRMKAEAEEAGNYKALRLKVNCTEI